MRTAETQDKDEGLWRPCQDLIARFGSRMCKLIIKSELADLPVRVRRTWFGSGTAGGVWLRGWDRTGPALALWNSSRSMRVWLYRGGVRRAAKWLRVTNWRGRGVAADFAVIGRLRRARVGRPGLGPEGAKKAQRH